VGSVAVGFTRSTHGARLLKRDPGRLPDEHDRETSQDQAIARRIVDEPSHRGVAAALELISDLAERKTVGFDSISIDRRVEYRDGIRLGQFASPDEGFAEIARKTLIRKALAATAGAEHYP